MENNRCSICKREVNAENADIIAVGGYGNPRYICEDCVSVAEKLTYSESAEEIEAAMAELSKRIAASGVDDPVTVRAVNEMFKEAGERAKKIKDGTYVSSAEEKEVLSEQEDVLEVPEELRESEEDKALDEAEKINNRKFDRVLNWIMIILAAVALAAIAYFVIKRFV